MMQSTITITGEEAFVNTYRHGLDSKRRITIPSEWRAQMGSENSLYVLPDVSRKCLFMVTPLMMKLRLERIRSQPMSDSKTRDFYRALGARSERVSWDTQGRFRIKDDLLGHAQIRNDVVMLGTIDRIEIWDPASLEQMGLVAEKQFEEAAKHVGF
ncbi:MAG: hypothetical protein QME60_06920 [Verrucomicrobiota bacterium]|nr:hypothetical protein [Verrucomicrobiota bacterium]